MIIKINGQKFEYFDKFTVDLKYNSIASTFSFGFYFDPAIHSKLHDFKAFSKIIIEDNNEVILTGIILSHTLPRSPKKQLNVVAGYSLPGQLGDTTIPISSYPLQSTSKSLKQLCDDLCAPFNINVEVDPDVMGDANLIFDESTAEETETIQSYLSKLASQRGIVLSHTPTGSLFLTKAKLKASPILEIVEGDIPNLEMVLSFDGQGMHKNINVLKDSDPESGAADEVSVLNPFVDIEKSTTKILTSGAAEDLQLAVKSALGNDLKGIKLIINFDRFDPKGKVIRPNSIITVIDPQLKMSNKVRWFIDSVKLTGSPKEKTANITCYLPESLNGNLPSYIFD